MVWIDQNDGDADRSGRYIQLKDRGDHHLSGGDCPEAITSYITAITLMPERFEAHLGLGMAVMQMGDTVAAEAAFGSAFRINPRCEEACAGLAMIHQERRDYQRAFDLYLKCLEINNDNMVALLGLFQASRQMGTFSKIIRYLEIYLDRHPDDSAVLFCLASLYAREGKWPQARKAALGVLVLEPGKPEAAELLTKVESRIVRSRAMEAGII